MATNKRAGTKPARELRASRMLENVRQWLGFGYCMAMLALFPLFFSPNTYYTITDDKFSFFRACTLLFLVLLLTGVGQAALDGWRPTLSIKGIWSASSITQKMAALLALLWVLSTLFSPLEMSEEVQSMFIGDPWTGNPARFNGLQTHLLYVLAFFLALWCGIKHRDWILWGFAAAMILISVIGILQAWGKNPLYMYDPHGVRSDFASFYTTVGNSNFVSGMLCLGIPVCAASFVLTEGKSRWLFLSAALASFYLLLAIDVDSGKMGMGAFLLLFPLLCCNTPRRLSAAGLLLGLLCFVAAIWRMAVPSGGPGGFFQVTKGFGKGCMLFLAAGVVLLALSALLHFRADKLPWSKKGVTRALAILLAVLILAGVAGFCAVRLPESAGFLYEAQQIVLEGNWNDHFGTDRLFIWKRVPALVMQAPLLGTGPSSFKGAFQESYLEEVKAFSAYGDQIVVYDSAHNIYLDYAVESGLLGLLCYLGVIVTLIVRALRLRDEEPFALILLCALLTYCAQGMFSFTNIVVAPVVWVIMGLMEFSLRRQERALSASRPK